jgi:cytochrome oxidase Cu insertion factor (SCO1/SenC/PrrC family)
MRRFRFVLITLAAAIPALAAAIPALASAQQQKRNDADFVKEKPAIGEVLPEVSVYSPDGKEFRTSDLRGHYTVLTFGCLT